MNKSRDEETEKSSFSIITARCRETSMRDTTTTTKHTFLHKPQSRLRKKQKQQKKIVFDREITNVVKISAQILPPQTSLLHFRFGARFRSLSI